jgi:hypothetical protein
VIKTIVKLAFVALLANAGWQLFTVYFAHFKFNDAVQQTTQFRGNKTDAQLRERILELAGQFDVPVTDENLTVQLVDDHTLVDSAYTRPVELVPRFPYLWRFTVHTDTVQSAALLELSQPK